MPRKAKQLNLNRRQFYPVPLTLEPRRKLRFIDGSKEDVKMAVNEAEFLARILEHKQVTPEITNTIRVLTVTACLILAKELDTHHVEPEMVRDIYPYADSLQARTYAKFSSRSWWTLSVTHRNSSSQWLDQRYKDECGTRRELHFHVSQTRRQAFGLAAFFPPKPHSG